MTEITQIILRLIAERPGLTTQELTEELALDLSKRMNKLRKADLVSAVTVRGKHRYRLTHKGECELAKVDREMGEIAAPRTHVSTQPYTGERWVTRPGSEPHAGYRRPMLIASAVLPSKGLAL